MVSRNSDSPFLGHSVLPDASALSVARLHGPRGQHHRAAWMEPTRHMGSPVGPVWPPASRSLGVTSSRRGQESHRVTPRSTRVETCTAGAGSWLFRGRGGGARPSAVPSQAPQCRWRGQARPRKHVGLQRQDLGIWGGATSAPSPHLAGLPPAQW